ncbi:MAG: alpha/beta hydrolase family protein [Pyrinomonadaceae bacterium]
MKALCTCLLVLMVGVALTVALAASGQKNVGAQSSYQGSPQNTPPHPLPPRNSNGPGEPPHPHASPTPCPGLRDCTAAENDTPKQFHVEFPGPDGMTLHGHMYVPGVSTQAQFDALTKPPASGHGHIAEATPKVESTAGGIVALKRLYPAVIYNHGSEPDPKGVPSLAKLYVDHGYVFFAPDRHGQGLSKDAGTYIVDREHAGENSLMLHKLYNKDVTAAVEWFKKLPYVNPNRIAMTGISYGGIQTLLTAEKDPGIRAYVPFAPAAESWGNQELRQYLINVVQNENAPIFIIQAEGDYNTGPVTTLGQQLALKGNPRKWKSKLYPPFGCTNQDAHARFAMHCDGISIWDQDVLAFLDEWVR